ncbi:MAG: MFS transporter, partial [Alphaproteobacteria bacterium]|nr:MFS transporter [Alphaproteobacteria bacterium]
APMLSFAGLWAVPWLQDAQGLSHTGAAATASAGFAGWGIGSAIAGGIFKKVQNRKGILIGSMTIMMLILAFMLASNVVLGLQLNGTILATCFFVIGFVNGTMIIAFIFCRENNAPENSGTALGTVNMCVVGSGAVMQPLIGYLLDLQWTGLSDENGRRIFENEAYALGAGSLVVVILIGILSALFIKDEKQA